MQRPFMFGKGTVRLRAEYTRKMLYPVHIVSVKIIMPPHGIFNPLLIKFENTNFNTGNFKINRIIMKIFESKNFFE